MAKKIKIWFDKESDFLEVMFSDAPGYMRETNNDNVLERIDDDGNIIGYSILGISKIRKDNPITAELEFA